MMPPPSGGGKTRVFRIASRRLRQGLIKMHMQYQDVLQRLSSLSNPEWVAGMARFGINTHKAYGISIPNLRKIAREIKKNHSLAQQLWDSCIHEERILASMIGEPQKMTEEQMERWVKEFDSWDVCDGCCSNLFHKNEFAYKKAVEWSSRPEEFVKRAGFVLMASLAVHDKKASDKQFLDFLPLIKRESTDDRKFVRKAVNWALRQIGKRNDNLNRAAQEAAKEINATNSKPARWIASDALRELTSENVQRRLRGYKGFQNSSVHPRLKAGA